jgi:hypothetical protein
LKSWGFPEVNLVRQRLNAGIGGCARDPIPSEKPLWQPVLVKKPVTLIIVNKICGRLVGWENQRR